MSTLATILTAAPPWTVFGTLTGAGVTQWWATRRERVQWGRDGERQRETRTFEQRCQAYATFCAQLRVARRTIDRAQAGLGGQAVGEAWQEDLDEAFAMLSFYASPAVRDAAVAARDALEVRRLDDTVVFVAGEWEVDDDELVRTERAAESAAAELLRAIQHDLGVSAE